jgi:uncharacterized repeat protein (TIGR01451 family)
MSARFGGFVRVAALLVVGATVSASVTLAHPGAAVADSHCTTSGSDTICAVDITVAAGSEFSGEVGTQDLTALAFNQCTPFAIDYTIDWGDGSTSEPTSLDCTFDNVDTTSLTVYGSHTYAAAGSYTLTLTFFLSSSVSTTATAIVSGASGPPAVGLSASSVGFGDQPVGSRSTAQEITISNTAGSQSQSLQVGQLAIDGANSGDFTLGSDTCSNQGVAPGSSCTLTIAFTPAHAGTRSASLSIPSNAASSPDAVSLSGNGTSTALADVKLSISGPSSAKRGAQVTYVITVSNAGPSAAHNVVMSDPTPTGASFAGVSATRGTCVVSKAGRISCFLGDLAAGGSSGSVVSVKLTAKIGSTVSNLASAYSTTDGAGPATADPDTSNNWATLTTAVAK